MLFKNAHVFRLTRRFDTELSQLVEALEANRFVPCSGTRPSSFGWISPLDADHQTLAHEVAARVLLCARREDKLVPASALGELLAEKVARLEAMEGRPLRGKEKQRLKDDALAELLPRALPRSKRILGYISPAEDLLVIDTATAAEAEMFVSYLRETLGSLPVSRPQIRAKPEDVFTHWLKSQQLPDNFSLGDQCELVDAEDGSYVACRRQALNSAEIRVHLDAGKRCTRLALVWHEHLKVTLDTELVLKQIKSLADADEGYNEAEQNADQAANAIAQLDAAFVSMALEFSRFLPALFTALGGETREETG